MRSADPPTLFGFSPAHRIQFCTPQIPTRPTLHAASFCIFHPFFKSCAFVINKGPQQHTNGAPPGIYPPFRSFRMTKFVFTTNGIFTTMVLDEGEVIEKHSMIRRTCTSGYENVVQNDVIVTGRIVLPNEQLIIYDANAGAPLNEIEIQHADNCMRNVNKLLSETHILRDVLTNKKNIAFFETVEWNHRTKTTTRLLRFVKGDISFYLNSTNISDFGLKFKIDGPFESGSVIQEQLIQTNPTYTPCRSRCNCFIKHASAPTAWSLRGPGQFIPPRKDVARADEREEREEVVQARKGPKRTLTEMLGTRMLWDGDALEDLRKSSTDN